MSSYVLNREESLPIKSACVNTADPKVDISYASKCENVWGNVMGFFILTLLDFFFANMHILTAPCPPHDKFDQPRTFVSLVFVKKVFLGLINFHTFNYV